MRLVLELASISLVIGWAVALVARAPWRKRETPPPAPPVRIYAFTMRFNGALVQGVVSHSICAASLALQGRGKPTVRA